MRPRDPKKQALTVRLDAALVDRLRTFCRDQAGKPFYASVNGIVAEALGRELDRLDAVLDDSDPPDRHSGHRGTSPPRIINAH